MDHLFNTRKFILFHSTKKDNISKIIKASDFISSNSDYEWLANGVYFWDNMINAKWWTEKRGFKNDAVIYKCLIKCPEINYLDLDILENTLAYNNFIRDFYLNYSSNKSLYDENIKEFNLKNRIEARKFFINFFCEKNNIYLVKRTFYYNDKKHKGLLEIPRTQFCVIDGYQDKLIKNMEVL